MDFRAIPIETLREYAREASVRTSMRQVAAEAGVGRTTLQNFVQGGTSPHPRVKRALAEWYLRERDQAAHDAVAEDFAAALEVLVAELPEEARRQARATLLEILDRVHSLVGVPLPAGLAALRERLARG
jgi:AcrR family transcriptional regulator